MNLELINLILLQKLDIRMDKLKRVEIEGPEEITTIMAEYEAAELKVTDSINLEQEMVKRRRELEAEISDTDEKVKANLGRQLQVKTNDEYRALLKEIDFFKKSNSTREDEALELIESLETLVEENEQNKIRLEEEKKRCEEKKTEIEKLIDISRRDQAKLELERRHIVEDVAKNHMALYNKAYNSRNGRAVVPILEGICQECFLQIPPQTFNELQRNEQLLTCPNCQRIIFWGEHEDFADY